MLSKLWMRVKFSSALAAEHPVVRPELIVLRGDQGDPTTRNERFQGFSARRHRLPIFREESPLEAHRAPFGSVLLQSQGMGRVRQPGGLDRQGRPADERDDGTASSRRFKRGDPSTFR